MLDAIHTLFNSPALRRGLLKLRYLIAIGFLIAVGRYAEPEWFWPALAVATLGELIQLWSFASLVKNEELTARGPYVMVRNPMYLGRFFVILGFVLLPANVYLALGYVVLYYFYMVNRVGREEKRLARLLGEPYLRYCQEVNRFVPALGRIAQPNVRFFDWGVLRANNGHWNLLSVIVVFAALYAFMHW